MAQPTEKKPNILVIWGDDIGISNLSCYSHGLMGYQTPNIDRIAKEGMMFTDSYGEQSCTAGRSSFITGQILLPHRPVQGRHPRRAAGHARRRSDHRRALEAARLVTGQFGKNHLGDRNEFLPTVHGFDEFYGNLYHLNAEEEPEMDDYPPEKDFPNFRKKFGPRGVLHCKATDKDDSDGRSAFRKGRQADDRGHRPAHQEAHGDLRRRIRCISHRLHQASEQGEQAVLRVAQHHAHASVHAHQAGKSRAGGPLAVALSRHDDRPRQERRPNARLARPAGHRQRHFRDVLDRQRTAHEFLAGWRHDAVPQREELELGRRLSGFRASCAGPARSRPASSSTRSSSTTTGCRRFSRMAGEPDIVEKCKKGHKAGGKTFKVHIDGYNLLPFLTQEGVRSPRKGFVYFNDDGDIVALRFDNWKVVFMEQRVEGTLRIWAEPFVTLRIPKVFNLRTDPYERADITSNSYYEWFLYHDYIALAASVILVPFLETFKDFPPRQKPGSFSLDQALQRMNDVASGAGH